MDRNKSRLSTRDARRRCPGHLSAPPVTARARSVLLISDLLRTLVKAGTTEFPGSQARGCQLILGVLLFLANVVAVYVVFAPLDFRMPDYGLEPWIAVLGEASAHDWRLGRDIIFTGGPLSSLYEHWFQPDHLDRYLAANVTLVVAFALLMTTMAWRNRRIAAGFLVAAGIASCFFAGRDGIFVAYPLLVSLIVLCPDRGVLEKAA